MNVAHCVVRMRATLTTPCDRCHLQTQGHKDTCAALMSKGLVLCKACGLVCPDWDNLKQLHWPGQRHHVQVAWLKEGVD